MSVGLLQQAAGKWLMMPIEMARPTVGRTDRLAKRVRDPRVAVALVVLVALAIGVLAALSGLDLLALVVGGSIGAGAAAVAGALWLRPDRRRSERIEARIRGDVRAQASRTRRAIHAAERRLYSQLEALSWLQQSLSLDAPLPPTRGAAASPDLLLELVHIIDQRRPRFIVELGSGVSTIVMAARCRSAGEGRVVALEHDAGYAAQTRTQLRAQGLEGEAAVIDAPLEDVTLGDTDWRWYRRTAELPDRIDLLFVDGPPQGTGQMARYPALPVLHDRLAPGALVVVDDGRRDDEREMVARWQAEFPGLDAIYLPHAKGTWCLTMPD